MSQKNNFNLPSLPISKRRYLLILRDEKVESWRDKKNKELEPSSWNKAKRIFRNTNDWYASINPAVKLQNLVADKVMSYLHMKDIDYDELGVIPVTWSEAQSLIFTPGHPRENVFYIAHPIPTASQLYYPMADYHPKVFEHKFSELIDLLTCLGVKHIEVEHVKGWFNEVKVDLSASEVTDEVKANASEMDAGSSRLMYVADYSKNPQPSMPDEAKLYWYKHEPTWGIIADGRLKNGMDKFTLSLKYQEDYGVNAGLRLKAKGCGVEASGTFKEFVDTEWKISGIFHPYPQ